MNGEAWVVRFCISCGEQTHDYPSAKSPECFSCGNAKNPYAQKNIRFSVDAAGEDSTNPARIADGTAGYNLALPDVPGEVIGKDAYGMTKRRMRPVLNSEIASTRQLREMGKRAGLTMLEAPKRAVGR